MRGLRYDRILAGTAVALVLAAVTPADAAPSKNTGHKPAKITTAAPAAAPTEAARPAPAPAAAADVAGDPVQTETIPATTATPAAAPAAAATAAPAPAATATAPAPAATASAPAAAPAAAAPVAASETVAPDPLASLDPADRPIAEKIRDLLAAKTDKIFANKKEHAAVETFYQNRNLAPCGSKRESRTIAPKPPSRASGPPIPTASTRATTRSPISPRRPDRTPWRRPS